jgi:hypothetical protein
MESVAKQSDDVTHAALLSRGFRIGATILVLAYLLAIPFGFLGAERKFAVPEVVLIGLLLLFNSRLLDGLTEMTVSSGGLKIVRRVVAEQERLRDEVDWLRFLIRSSLNEYELLHLTRLNEPRLEFRYQRQPSFDAELRRLRSMRLIELVNLQSLNRLPQQGDLKQHVRITEEGVRFLGRLARMDSDNAAA